LAAISPGRIYSAAYSARFQRLKYIDNNLHHKQHKPRAQAAQTSRTKQHKPPAQAHLYVHNTLHNVAAVGMRAWRFEISIVAVFSLQSAIGHIDTTAEIKHPSS